LKLIRFLIILLPLSMSAQFVDDFSDGNFNANPAWTGDVADFEVDMNNELHLNAAPMEGISTLVTPSIAVDTSVWEFQLRMDFNPSSSNRARVYLMSSSDDLTGSLNGYFVQLGNSQDEVSLYVQTGTSTTKIIDGVDDLLDTDPAEVLVRVTRSTYGLWELFSDTTLLGNYTSEGTVTDTTHESSSWFGVWCDYTSTRSDKFYFDDFLVTGNAYLDVTAPELLSASTISSDELLLVFSEPLDPATATSNANYSVSNGIGQPVNAVLDGGDPSRVTLTFATNFTTGQTNTLTVSNVEDVAGNVISTSSLDFTYFQFQPAAFRDIVINEIMADPSPMVLLPETEFVEIYNASNKTINLAGFTFSDPSTTGAFPDAPLPFAPGEYLILCDEDDTALFSSYGSVLGLSSFPSLNNSGDEITLTDSSGQVLDVVRYTDSWYQDTEKDDGGITLEQINPGNPCTGRDNWRASENLDGGTPGQQNSVYDTSADTISPIIESFELTDLSTLVLTFSKTMDSTSLFTAGYALDNGLTIDSLTLTTADFTELALNFGSTLDSSILYGLSISGLVDCQGNSLSGSNISFGFGVSPKAFEVLITELYPDPDEASGLPLIEFVEIHNVTDKLIRLADVQLSDRGDASFVFTTVLLPGEYAIVCDDGNAEEMSAFGKVAPVSTMPSLNNSDDEISLIKGAVTLDAVAYSSSWYGDGEKAAGGWTLERVDVKELCGLANNWRASEADLGGTPGQENSVGNAGSIASEPSLIGAQVLSRGEVILSFDKRLDSASVATGSIEVGSQLATSSILSEGFSEIEALFADSLERGTQYSITVEGITDCIGQSLTTNAIDFYLHQEGDIVLNEVLFNPRGSGTDFVELFNNSDFDINLQGWAMTSFNTDERLVLNIISQEVLMLPSQEYLCLHEDSVDLVLNYPGAATDNFHEMNLPSYANTDGLVMIHDALTEQMDRFDYSEDFHFALITDPDGVSLERLDPNRATNDPDNWHSASSNDNFATPGYLNSQVNLESSATETISLSSDIFSPDNDGYQDVVNVNYTTGQPGWSCNIAIYDHKGYLIKQLVTNEILGATGTFTWDGTTDTQEKARTGIHIFNVELFDLAGERQSFRLPCVVATRL